MKWRHQAPYFEVILARFSAILHQRFSSYVYSQFFPLIGLLPISNMCTTMPKLNRSHLALQGLMKENSLRNTYGAMQPIVPHFLKQLLSALPALSDSPKSISLHWYLPSIWMFCGLTSRWMILRSCSSFRQVKMEARMVFICSKLSYWLSLMNVRRSVPSNFYMISTYSLFYSQNSISCEVCGQSLRRERILRYQRTNFLVHLLNLSSLLIFFAAQTLPLCLLFTATTWVRGKVRLRKSLLLRVKVRYIPDSSWFQSTTGQFLPFSHPRNYCPRRREDWCPCCWRAAEDAFQLQWGAIQRICS